MKKLYILLIMAAVCISLPPGAVNAQCGGGYTQAQLNWDNMDYYFNSGGGSPYGSYITDAMEMSQRFAIGTNWVTIATSNNAIVTTSENATHTGEIANYTGEDVQYTPSVNNQTITLTFNTEVTNLNFTLYDIDRSQRIDFAARNAASVLQNVNVVTYASSILTISNNNATNAYVTATNTSLANNLNTGSATITVAGPVRSITLTITTIGSDPTFWLSDINACVTGSFPNNWHQGFSNRPLQGPTQNQPDYFLVTPDNNSCYMMDPATGRCWYLFTDASRTYMNSFAYDPASKFLYYISENVSLNASNRALKRYDFNTETISTVIADITTTLGIPTFNGGVESAAASFYNGNLYLGVEGGESSSTIRESMVWCVNLATNTAYQVYSTPSYDGSGIIHDWADIVVEDGVLVNYNSARRSSNFSFSSYTHVNLMSGATTRYNNPNPASKYAGQAGLSWNGNMYMIYDSVWLYNAGVISGRQQITVQSVPGDPAPIAWVGNAGDGSDPFRPRCDFGDAPATYDPNPVSPAVHERSETIRLGATWTREWTKTGVTGNNDSDDGNSYVNFLPQGSGNYLAYTYASNNSGAAATLIAWLDYNGNGVFDASEATVAQTVPNGTNNQLYWLYWPSLTTPLINGQTTYMRIRITSASAGMTTAHATGYFVNGEVEDYLIPVDNYPLSVSTLSFNAAIWNNNNAKLNWTVTEQNGLGAYEVQKSRDGSSWEYAGFVPGKGTAGEHTYEFTDFKLQYGKTYYRLKMAGVNGNKYSEVRVVERMNPADRVQIRPNPVKNTAVISINSAYRSVAELGIFTESGLQVYSGRVAVTDGMNLVKIPVKPDWPTGVYILRVNLNNENIYKKMIVEQ